MTEQRNVKAFNQHNRNIETALPFTAFYRHAQCNGSLHLNINFANLWSLIARLIFHLIEISMKTIHNADRLDSLIQKSSSSRNNQSLTNSEQCYSLRISAFTCLREVSVCSFIKSSTNQVYAMTSRNINRHKFELHLNISISLNNLLRPRASPTLERPLILIHCS